MRLNRKEEIFLNKLELLAKKNILAEIILGI
jgi:hypothetical protein